MFLRFQRIEVCVDAYSVNVIKRPPAVLQKTRTPTIKSSNITATFGARGMPPSAERPPTPDTLPPRAESPL